MENNLQTKQMMLELIDVSKFYKINGKRMAVLKNVNITGKSGEIIAITGPSGSGKSTLLNLIAGLTRPNKGKILFNGKNPYPFADIIASKNRNRHIGFIFQTFKLLNNESVLNNILLPARIGGNVSKHTIEYVYALSEKFGLKDFIKTKAGLLSGGQKQRVAMIRALINNPEIILADEPTANLDDKTTDTIFNILMEIKEKGKLIIIVTHKNFMLKKADVVYELENGIINKKTDG